MDEVTSSIVLEVTDNDKLGVPLDILEQAGFTPGDRLVLSITAPGHIHLHKTDVALVGEALSRKLRQLIQQSFHQSGYYSREQIVALVREVRQELAAEK